jgi:MFS family permease
VPLHATGPTPIAFLLDDAAPRNVTGPGRQWLPVTFPPGTPSFPEGRLRTRALGLYAAMTGLGGGVGVVAGGLLTTYASWR